MNPEQLKASALTAEKLLKLTDEELLKKAPILRDELLDLQLALAHANGKTLDELLEVFGEKGTPIRESFARCVSLGIYKWPGEK